jgi:hypothetical protein
MANRIYLDKLDPLTSRIVGVAFPAYRGKKFAIEIRDYPIDVRSYWDGGSRDYFTFVNLTTYETMAMPAQSGFDRQIQGADSVTIPAGFACVQHTIFCGKDLGLTIIVGPSNAALLITEQSAALTEDQTLVLAYTRGRKSSYAGRDRCDMAIEDMRSSRRFDPSKPEPITRDRWNSAKASLIDAGYLNKAGAITVKGKNAIGDKSIY